MSSSKLGDVALVSNGKTPAVSEQREAGFPVLKIRDVDALGYFRGSFASFVDKPFAEKFSAKHLQQGDTLILNAAHNAEYVASKTFYAASSLGGPLVTGEWTIVRPNPGRADFAYIRHFLESAAAKQQLKEMVNGIHLYPKDVARLIVPLPPLPEQRRIAAILDKADALRAKRREAIAKLDQLLQSVFLDMFGAVHSDDVKSPLRDLAEPTKNSFTNGPFGSDLLAEELVDSGVPVIYIRDIRDGIYTRVSGSHVTTEKAEKIRACRVSPGDLLISKVGDPPGVAAVYPDSEPPGVVTQDVIRLRPDKKRVLSVYLWALLNSELGKRLIKPIIVEATRARFSLGDLKAVEISVPSLERQRRFADFVSAVQRQSAHLQDADLATKCCFLSVQNQAFNGGL